MMTVERLRVGRGSRGEVGEVEPRDGGEKGVLETSAEPLQQAFTWICGYMSQ